MASGNSGANSNSGSTADELIPHETVTRLFNVCLSRAYRHPDKMYTTLAQFHPIIREKFLSFTADTMDKILDLLDDYMCRKSLAQTIIENPDDFDIAAITAEDTVLSRDVAVLAQIKSDICAPPVEPVRSKAPAADMPDDDFPGSDDDEPDEEEDAEAEDDEDDDNDLLTSILSTLNKAEALKVYCDVATLLDLTARARLADAGPGSHNELLVSTFIKWLGGVKRAVLDAIEQPYDFDPTIVPPVAPVRLPLLAPGNLHKPPELC